MTETLGRMGRPQKFGRSRKHYGHSIPRRINSIDQTVYHLVGQRLLHQHYMPSDLVDGVGCLYDMAIAPAASYYALFQN
jgi:hypothetical protein